MDGKLDQKENGLDVRIFKERFWHSVMTCKQGSTGRPLAVLVQDSWIFEKLVPFPKAVVDVPFSSTAFVVGEQTSEIQSRSLRTETRNLEI